jgi:hypothetical protein
MMGWKITLPVLLLERLQLQELLPLVLPLLLLQLLLQLLLFQ